MKMLLYTVISYIGLGILFFVCYYILCLFVERKNIVAFFSMLVVATVANILSFLIMVIAAMGYDDFGFYYYLYTSITAFLLLLIILNKAFETRKHKIIATIASFFSSFGGVALMAIF